MRKRAYLTFFLVLALFLCACTTAKPKPTGAVKPKPTVTAPPTTEAPTAGTTVPVTTTVPETTQTVPTTAAHSPLYLPQYTVQQVWEYFEEVVLHMEYTNGEGNPSLVQKWETPLCYRIYGEHTDTDLAILENLFTQLNHIEGFPGIYAGAEGDSGNLIINFLEPDAFRDMFSEVVNGEDAFGATQFWYYTDTNEIYTANVGYRTDIDQITQSSILLEEIVNTLGISDTELRTDSIVYQYSNTNYALSDMDWLILNLLYDPAIQRGMDADSCRQVIESLYY